VSIGDIRNPWLRRPLVVLLCLITIPVCVALAIVEGVIEGVKTLRAEVPAAWRQ